MSETDFLSKNELRKIWFLRLRIRLKMQFLFKKYLNKMTREFF